MALILGFALAAHPARAYEDQSHQQLTRRALQIAREYSSDLPDTFGADKEWGLQIIAGAGRHEGAGMLGLPTDGEDYTIYRIEGDCDVKVRKWGSPAGVL
jgi:hypothetical protein